MPSGIEVFEARIKRIEAGQQIQGEGLPCLPIRRRHTARRGGLGRFMLMAVLVSGSVTGAIAAGHGPEGLDTRLFALTAQVQQSMTSLIQTAAERGAGFAEGIVPSS